jgi:hypothetical protein
MFAFDTMLPVNAVSTFFVLLCLYACVVGIIEEPKKDSADSELPAAFRKVRDLANFPGRATPYAKDGAQRDGANGKQSQRPREQ